LASETFHFHPPLEAPPFPHSISDSIPDKKMQNNMDILYGLVFNLWKGVDDLQFWLQQLDGKASALLHILSTFQREAAQAEHIPA